MDAKKYCINQVEAIKRFKWIESQKAGRDLGEEAVRKWISENAKKYREEYKECLEEISNMIKSSIKSDKELTENICDECLDKLTKSIVEKFTEVWTMEVSKENHNPHLEEL